MPAPTDRRYSQSHEWHQLEGDTVTLGISKFAVDELTDVTFVELPDVGDSFEPGQEIGEIESVKATSEIYTAIAGTVTQVNDAVVDDPSLINNDPYGDGWLIKLKVADTSSLDALMDAETYQRQYPDS